MSALWATYEARVLPADCARIQKIETRAAFFAGAHAVLSLVNSICREPDEAIAVAMIQTLLDETSAFGKLFGKKIGH